MATFQIRITGNPGAAIQAKIDSIKKQANAAVQFAGLNTEGLAKRACPVDTGRLRSSIAYVKETDSSCRVGTAVFYAVFVEMGTRHMKPHPFLLPAFKNASSQLLQDLKAIK